MLECTRMCSSSRRVEHAAHILNSVVQVDHPWLGAARPCVREQLLHELGGPPGGPPDLVEVVARERAARGRAGGRRELGAADDHGEQIVEVVGDPARELADRFELLRLQELRLELVLLGHVLQHADRAPGPAQVVELGLAVNATPEDDAVAPRHARLPGEGAGPGVRLLGVAPPVVDVVRVEVQRPEGVDVVDELGGGRADEPCGLR